MSYYLKSGDQYVSARFDGVNNTPFLTPVKALAYSWTTQQEAETARVAAESILKVPLTITPA